MLWIINILIKNKLRLLIFLQELERIRQEKEKLSEVERRCKESAELVDKLGAGGSGEDAEMSRLHQRSQEDQDAVDNQRFLVDNLEFQMLEVAFLQHHSQ